MGYIPAHIEEYLVRNYDPDMSGADLAREMDIPSRSARRYMQHYRDNHVVVPPAIRPKVTPQTMDAVVFDIETTDFGTEGYAGRLVCCSFLPLNTGEVETLHIDFDDGGNDINLLTAVASKLSQYSFHIGHNIAAFDYNWLNSKLMFHSLPGLNSAYYFDTYQVARSLAIKTSKGLGNLIDYFGLEGVKTTIYRTSWSMISSPYEDDFNRALHEIREHCELDVAANRRLFDVLHHYSLSNGRAAAWKLTKVRGNYWKGRYAAT